MSTVVSKGLNIPDKLDAEMTKIVFECVEEGIKNRKGLMPEEDDLIALLNERLPEPPISVGKMEYLFLIAVANVQGTLTDEQYFQLFMNIQGVTGRAIRQELYTLTDEVL